MGEVSQKDERLEELEFKVKRCSSNEPDFVPYLSLIWLWPVEAVQEQQFNDGRSKR